MIAFHCSYCKGQGHFASHCLKRITKSCTDSICRDYNRFERSNCEFGDSCVYDRRHVCLICTDANCKAYFHVHSASQPKGWSTLPKKNENLINALVKVIEKISEVFERHEAILSQISKAKDQNQTNTTSKSPLSTNNADTSTAKTTSPSRGILALPVVSAHKEILMPISTGFPLSSTSLEHASICQRDR